MYAIVRGGGRQLKVSVGDVVQIDLIGDEVGESVSVTAEVLGLAKGPKIRIIKYKNKTGYKKRQGHRQRYTQVKITGIK